MSFELHDLMPADMPLERFKRLGPKALSDTELLAIVLRTGTKGSSVLSVSDKILNLNPQFDGLVSLMHYDWSEFLRVSGVGEVKAIQLGCIGEIASRIWNRQKRTRHLVFSSASIVSAYYQEELRYLDHEVVKVLFLDSHQQLMKERLMAEGTCNTAAISQRDIFIEALRISAVCFIVVHNHPSGDPSPSEEDIIFTEKLYEGAELLGFSLCDHVIIGDNAYYSFREQEIIGGE